MTLSWGRFFEVVITCNYRITLSLFTPFIPEEYNLNVRPFSLNPLACSGQRVYIGDLCSSFPAVRFFTPLSGLGVGF